jgi:hypothetical protein
MSTGAATGANEILPQQCLNFLPLPHWHGSFLPGFQFVCFIDPSIGGRDGPFLAGKSSRRFKVWKDAPRARRCEMAGCRLHCSDEQIPKDA